jgi:FKBP-type peptidyl-prolyl cis-trans isomerase SlyD
MIISSPCVVSLVWRLEDAQGQLVDELTEPMEFLVGGEDLLPKVEEVLDRTERGLRGASAAWSQTQAFGDYDARVWCFSSRARSSPPEVSEGMQFDGPPEGAQDP